MRTSSEFDEMLDRAHTLLLQMAARVERQIDDAAACLGSGSTRLIEQVLEPETAINDLERAVDALAVRFIEQRKPAAGELRLLLALLKSTTDLERIGDEAKKIALVARHIADAHWPMRPHHPEVARMAQLALQLVRQATSALERLDAGELTEAAARERALDTSLHHVLRELITHMIEDPRMISSCLDMVFVAKSLERIGDHATNVLEHVVYAAQGHDLRHAPPFSS